MVPVFHGERKLSVTTHPSMLLAVTMPASGFDVVGLSNEELFVSSDSPGRIALVRSLDLACFELLASLDVLLNILIPQITPFFRPNVILLAGK